MIENQESVSVSSANSTEVNWEEKYVESNEKYLRLLAEFENYKKRVVREKDEIRQSVKASMISSILDVDSDLAIAMKNQKDNQGIVLIMSKLETFLKNHGIEPIQTDAYDSELHEVISVIETGRQEIVDVVSKGYSINGKPIRYPKIILGK